MFFTKILVNSQRHVRTHVCEICKHRIANFMEIDRCKRIENAFAIKSLSAWLLYDYIYIIIPIYHPFSTKKSHYVDKLALYVYTSTYAFMIHIAHSKYTFKQCKLIYSVKHTVKPLIFTSLLCR